MKNSYIYLPIEIKSRELLPKLWLASQLAMRNFICILGDKPGIETAMELYPRGIYFDKSIARAKTNKLRQLVNKTHVLVCQDEESGIARTEMESFFNVRISEENIKLTRRFYCWGESDYKYLCNKYEDYVERFCMTGGLRIDLWREEICNRIYEDDIKSIKEKYNNFILINSSFGVTNDFDIQKILDYIVMRGDVSEEDYPLKKNNLEALLQEFYSFSEMISTLAKKRPKLTFVVRPHPAESLDGWRKIFKQRDNLFLVREGDVTPWIAACDALIHPGCTTALQAILMGKPVFSFVSENGLRSHVNLNDFPNQINYKTHTVEELLNAIDGIENSALSGKQVDYKKRQKSLDDRISNFSGRYAADLIAKDLEGLNVPRYSPPSKMKKYITSLYRRILNRVLRDIVNRDVGEKPVAPTSMQEKMPGGIQREEVESFIHKLKSIDSELGKLRVSEIGKNVFQIYKGI